jgi:hypothetical protein
MAKTFFVSISSKGKHPLQWFEEVKELTVKQEEDLVGLANLCANRMSGILQASGYHLEKLANAIKVESIDSMKGLEIGIGKISDFPVGQESGASYWEAFNDGFKVTQENIGYFTSGSGMSGDKTPPESGMSGQKWVHTGKTQGSFYMKPNKVISPLNYIGIAAEELRANIIKQMDKLNSELEKAGK